MTRMRPLALAALMAAGAPVMAANTLVAAGTTVQVARSGLTVTPPGEWNRLGARPGRSAETWTRDGDPLNDLTFYGGIETGKPIIREVSRKDRPLPAFSSTMLLTDVPPLLEQSYRIALDSPLVSIGKSEPATVAGRPGIRFAYRFTRPDEDVERQGEAWAMIDGGRLYMMSYEAPAIHFFDKDAEAARVVMATARIEAIAPPPKR